ncbi:MAG: transposase family protein [Pseudomonadota bacterium]|jgi:putative transposase|nr:transposase family protein [Pseudomonadota bacterium]
MKSFTLSTGGLIRYDGQIYKITETLNRQALGITSLNTSQLRYVSEHEILTAYRSGLIEFLDEDEVDLSNNQQSPLEIDFTSYTAAEKSRAFKKLAYLEALEEFTPNLKTAEAKKDFILRVASKIGDEKPPRSWATIKRWQKDYEASGRDLISLIGESRKRGNRTPRFSDSSEKLTEKAINTFLTKEQSNYMNAYKQLRLYAWQYKQKTGLEIPILSYDAFRKRIDAIDKYLVAEKRFGKRIADLRFKAYKKGSTATRPLEIVEIDHTPVDLMVVDEESRIPLGRPTLTSLIDKFSRMVVGFYFSFTPPSTLSVIECLRHAILPKTGLKELYPSLNNDWPAHGIPETIVVDNGKEFFSADFKEIIRSLGMNIVRSPVKNPTYKGAVERHFRSVADDLLKNKPGKTFSNIFEKGEYDPKKHAVISLSSLIEITHLWIVDQINDTPNRSINTTPRRKWDSAISLYPVRLPKSIEAFNLSLGKITTRKIQHYGIDFESLRYNSDELSLIRRQHTGEVTIKYDPNDLSRIYVLNPLEPEYLVVPCNDLPYAYKTLYQHKLIKQFTRKQNQSINHDNLMRAEQRIAEIIEEETILTKKVRRAAKQARYRDIRQNTQDVQTLPGDVKSRPLDKISIFEEDEFDPYAEAMTNDSSNAAPVLFDNDDEDLESLYADDPEWRADYSRKDNK